jgi:hypothetical protein
MRTAPALATLLALLVLPLAVVAAPPAAVEPAAPPPPAKYDVTVRYSIEAPRNERVRQFRAMLDFFKQQGFTRDEEAAPEDEAENASYNTLSGTISAENARKLLFERHVRALRLVPAGAKLPEGPVRVQLELTGSAMTDSGRHLYNTAAVRATELEGGPDLQRQRLLAEQVLAALTKVGFSEAVGYDDRAHTRLLGNFPAGKLDILLDDLRRQPAAWQLTSNPPIDSILLAGLRRFAGGEAVLESVLNDWDAYFERKRRDFEQAAKAEKSELPKEDDLIGKMLAAWSRQKPAIDYVNSLPREVRESSAVVRALLLAQVVHHPDAVGVLQALWRDVLASPYAPELLSLLRRRLPAVVLNELPLLLRTDSAVRVTEVRPDLPAPRPRPAPPAIAKGQEKLTPDLRDLLAGGGDANKPQRLEVILWVTPDESDNTWQRVLTRAVPDLVIEGRVGPLVSVLVPPDQAPALAALPNVSTVRLPRSGQPRAVGAAGEKLETAEALKATGLVRLHGAGLKGKGVRLAIIDGDFRGWQEQVGKKLPANTRLLDLTGERNADLKPDANPDGGAVGHGTHVAEVAALAAPDADLLLVRIDPAAPYQLLTVARALNGQAHRSLNLARRAEELSAFRTELDTRRADLFRRRAAQMEKSPDVGQKRVLLKKKEKGALTADEEQQLKDIEEFEAYRKDQAKLDADQREYDERLQRYISMESELRNLRTVRIVATGLSWPEGQPVDGGGALGRYFDDEPFKKALWFQATGDTRGQAWAGLFHDRDGDGVMEFLPAGTLLPSGRWSPSLGFLSWQPATGKATADIPANTRIRLSIQWREPHEPDFLHRGEDAYRQPLTSPRLVLLRQLDPAGTKQPADDFEVVAQTTGLPQRLANEPGSAVYEQTVEFTVKEAGRYALRVEGRVPATIRPADAPTVPAAEKVWELRPRVFIETLAGPGRVVLSDFATAEGSLGTPGDARQAITVGAADATGKPLPTSAPGPAFGMDLLPKPLILSPAVGAGEGPASGTSLSAGFAAGLAASAMSAGAPTDKFLKMLGTVPGQLLRVPGDWPARR